MKPDKKRLNAILICLLILTGGAVAYTTVFTAGPGTSYETGSGLVVETTTDHALDGSNPFLDGETIYIDGVSISASGAASLTVDQFRGSRTKVSGINASSNTITVDPDDKSAAEISGGVTSLAWEDAALDGTAQITYSASGSGTITVTNLAANTTYAAATTSGNILTTGTTSENGEAMITVDAATDEDIVLLKPSSATFAGGSPSGESFNDENVETSIQVNDTDFGTDAGDEVTVDLFVDGSLVDSKTITSNKTVAFNVSNLADGSHSWHVETSDSYGLNSSSSTFSFEVNHYAPAASNATPANGTQLTSRETTFSVEVSDIDFAETSGDTVTAELFVDGSSVGTTSTSSNGTVSITHTISEGGEHSYYWVLTDEFGQSTTSSTKNVTVPAQITFRSESNPDVVLDNVQVNITAYYGNETLQTSTSNGKLNLSGFPVDEPIIIRATGDNYTTRTAVIESIYAQSNVYLLNTSIDTYRVRFQLRDPTGLYPDSETVLFIERDLTLNNSTEWRVISGDNIGVQGVSAELKQDERYRLRVRNLETGATTVIGAYTAIQSETVTISTGSATINIDDSTEAYGWEATKNESSQEITVEYLDSENETSEVELTIHERFNKSNVLVNNVTFTDANNILYQTALTDAETNTTWMAVLHVTRDGNTTTFRAPVVGPTQSIIPAELDGTWRSGVGVFILLITGMLFSGLNVRSGAVATAVVGGILWQIGFLTGVATAPAIALAIGVAAIFQYRGDGGGR